MRAFHQANSQEYRVPERISIAEILGITTAFALLFAILRQFDAPAGLYVFLGALGIVICLVQMRFGEMPRFISAVAGSILMSLWGLVTILFYNRGGLSSLLGALAGLPCTLILGGLLGYFTGTLAAGVFLVLDKLRRTDCTDDVQNQPPIVVSPAHIIDPNDPDSVDGQ